MNQFGRPQKVEVTPVGGSKVTITDVVELECDFSPELLEHFGGVDRYPLYTVGNDNSTITLKTTDTAALAWLKGMEFTTIAAVFELVFPTSGISAAGYAASTPSSSVTVGMTFTSAVAIEGAKFSNGADGKAGEISVKFRAAKLSAGTAASIAIDSTV